MKIKRNQDQKKSRVNMKCGNLIRSFLYWKRTELGFLFLVSLWGFDLRRRLCWRKTKLKRFRDSRAWRRKRLDFSCSNSNWTSDWSLSACVMTSWWRPGECDRWQSSRCGWCREEAAAVTLFQQPYCVFAWEPKLAAAAFLWGKHASCFIPD